MSKLIFLVYSGECRKPPDNSYGTIKGESWTGMIGQLVRDEADVAVAPLDQTYERSQVVNYLYAMSLEG